MRILGLQSTIAPECWNQALPLLTPLLPLEARKPSVRVLANGVHPVLDHHWKLKDRKKLHVEGDRFSGQKGDRQPVGGPVGTYPTAFSFPRGGKSRSRLPQARGGCAGKVIVSPTFPAS